MEIATGNGNGRQQSPPVMPLQFMRRNTAGAGRATASARVAPKKASQTVDIHETDDGDDISSRRSASGAENGAQVNLPRSNPPSPDIKVREEAEEEEEEEHFANNARHYDHAANRMSKEESSTATPDEDFMLNSEDGNQKLYSSATSEEQAEDARKSPSSPQALPTKPMTDFASRKVTSNKSTERSKKPTTIVRLGQSDDTEESSGNMRQKLYEEVVSGPETTGDEDDADFWG